MVDTPEARLMKAIFPKPEENPLPDFNDLVREAYNAQEAFDKWDNGSTFTHTGFRVCTLDEINKEWSEANTKLVRYVLKYGGDILLIEEAGDQQ